MSQLIPAALRAPQTTPAVQGAQRPAALRSGDDFARTLRQETGDRSSTTRSSERPSSRDDRGDTARSDRIDSRRADQRRSTSAPDASDAAGRPDATTSPETSPVVRETVALQPAPVVPAALLGVVSVVGAQLDAGAPTGAAADAAAPEPALGHGQPSAAEGVALPSATLGQGETPLGAAPGVGLAASLTPSAVAVSALGAASPGTPAGGTALGAGDGRALAAIDQLGTATSATDLTAPATTVRLGESVAVASALVPVAPSATGGGVVDATLTAVAGVAGLATADQGGASGGGTAGSGTGGGAPVTESVTPGAGPAPTSHAGTFAQALSGLAGVERASATAATGSTAQASLAEQVRGPVLALRTAAPGEHVLTLKVTPENLGPVQVRAHIGADGIRIELVGATDAAREGLRGLLTDLRRDLAGTGMNASLSLGADSGPGGRSGQGAAGDLGSTGDGSGNARSGHPTGATVAREPHTAPAVPVTPTSSGAHGVDILT